VTIEYVDEAHEREEEARLSELISKQPEHSKHLLQALGSEAKDSPGENPAIPTKSVYSMYERICESHGIDPLKVRRVRDLLSELAFLSLIEQERKGRGKGKGAHTVNQLVDDPDIVIKACESA
jgi:cell division control protein 6